MKQVNEIINELKGLNSPLAAMPREMPYQVPAGYFEQLPGDVLAIVNDTTIQAFEKQGNPHEVPAGYFNTLPLKMLQAAKAQEVIEHKEVAPAKRIALYPQVRWAVAAVMALVISLGGYVMFTGNNADNGAEKILSSIPGSEINEYVTHRYGIDPNVVAPDKENSNLKNVDTKDIVAYLDETGWD